MILKIPNRSEFISAFLHPLSKVNEASVIKVNNGGYSSLASSPDGALILYCNFKQESDTEDSTLNIPNLGRLSQILSCIETEDLELDYADNNISYSSKDIRFKYHLLEDGIISSPPIDIDKLKSIDYNTAFEITRDSLMGLIKSSSFTADTDKIYFYTKDGIVYGELTDHQKHNSDSVTRALSNKFTGDGIVDPIPVTFDIVRIIANNRADKITVLVNTNLSILTFEVNINNIKNVYVVTGLVKTV